MFKDHLNAIHLAKTWLAKKPLFLDTETTGLDDRAEICDISVIDHDGVILFDTLVRPTVSIPADATAVHSIDDALAAAAPTFADIAGRLADLVSGRWVVIYNAEYDLRMLHQSARANQLAGGQFSNTLKGSALDLAVCAMSMYAAFWGEWNEYHGNYRWQSLSNAAIQCGLKLPEDLHRARADAELTRQVVHYVANYRPKKETGGKHG
jgi:DNA polymerase III subunit epsilon